MIDTRLHTLLTLMEAGSYTKAARVLSLTQPAVSHDTRHQVLLSGRRNPHGESRKAVAIILQALKHIVLQRLHPACIFDKNAALRR